MMLNTEFERRVELSVRRLMDEREIRLVNQSKGELGEGSANLLGDGAPSRPFSPRTLSRGRLVGEKRALPFYEYSH